MAVARRFPSSAKKTDSVKSPLATENSEAVPASNCTRMFGSSSTFVIGSPTGTNAVSTNRSFDSLSSIISRRSIAGETDWWMVSGNSIEKLPAEAAAAGAASYKNPHTGNLGFKSAPTSPATTRVRRAATTPWKISSTGATQPPQMLDSIERCQSAGNLDRYGSPTPRSPGGIGDPTSPSPRRQDRVVEFSPRSSPERVRRASSPQSRQRRLRSSVGSSDLAKARPLVSRCDKDMVDSGLAAEKVDRDHFIVDTEMAFHRESNNDYRLNQYVLGKQIGRGAYGTVIEARSIYDQKKYAVKVVSKRRLKKAAFGHRLGAGSLDAVRREIAILKKVQHRNVVKLFEVINAEHDTDMYLVFELVEHGQILEVNQGECLSEERAWDYFIDLLLGIEYLHSLGIVHRDVKPSNLLVDADDRLKIADFGVSEMFQKDGTTRLSKTAGSPAFMAPEMLAVEPGDSINYEAKPLDIWSMGVTLYCWIYGQCPFWPEKPNDVVELQNRIIKEELTFPDEPLASDEVKDLLVRLLEKDPEKRITIAELKCHPWVTSRLGNEAQSCRLEKEATADRLSVTSEDIRDAVGGKEAAAREAKTAIIRERLLSPGSDDDSAFLSEPLSRDISPSSLSSMKTNFGSKNCRSPPTEDEGL